jgi:hypothetical protein
MKKWEAWAVAKNNNLKNSNSQSKIVESFEVNDLKNVLHDKIHIDEFNSKIGDDDQNIVVSFMVDDRKAAEDLIDFLERGYDYILDADLSTSEVKPGSYLVFVEIPRRAKFFNQITEIVNDLRAASNIDPKLWKFRYLRDETYFPLTKENIFKFVPLSPKIYRERFMLPIEESLNSVRHAAGIAVKNKSTGSKLFTALKLLAGMKV